MNCVKSSGYTSALNAHQQKKGGDMKKLGLALYILMLIGCGQSSEQKQATLELDAKWECKNAAESMLKAPSTATFQPFLNFGMKQVDGGYYSVNGYVDSQNSFGAMIRSRFVCVLESSESGQISLLEVKFLE